MSLIQLSSIVLLSLSTSIAYSQTCVDLPFIDGAQGVGTAPVGWSIWHMTPDIIAGNGPWPGGGAFVVSDVNGASANGGSMGLFIAGIGSNPLSWEGWTTTITGLTLGNSYEVNIQWQQATISNPFNVYSLGDLLMTIDGNTTVYFSSMGASDPWQIATKTFVATGPTAVFQFSASEYAGGVPPGLFGSCIVVDNILCSLVPSVNITSGTICEGSCFDLQATPNGAVGPVTYAWDNGILNTTAGPINVCPTTTTTYNVIATDSLGNIFNASSTITVNNSPTVDLGSDTTHCNASNIVIDPALVGVSFLWNDNSTAPTLSATTNGTYWVEVTSIHGCVSADTINVEMFDCDTLVPILEMPNVFSPNHDGVNDFFLPKTMLGIENAQMTILNRWGNIVFETSDLNEGWNGNFEDTPRSQGTYYWIIHYSNINGTNIELHGYLTLIRN